MQKHFSKHCIFLLAISILMVAGGVGILRSGSNAWATEQNLIINTAPQPAIQHIKEVHLGLGKAGLGSRGTTLQIVSVEQGKNQTPNNTTDYSGSVFGGQKNTTVKSSNSFILGGEENAIYYIIDTQSGGNAAILGGRKNSIGLNNSRLEGQVLSSGRNSTILASNDTHIYGDNSLAFGTKNTRISSNNSAAYVGQDIVIATGADDSLALGSKITISSGGTFAFNTEEKPLQANTAHTFIINTKNGVLIGTDKKQLNDTGTQLTVSGAIRIFSTEEFLTGDSKGTGTMFSRSCTYSGALVTCQCMKTADGKSIGIGERGECHGLCAARMQGGTGELKCSDFKYDGKCGDAATAQDKTSWYPEEQEQWKRGDQFCSGSKPYATPSFPEKNRAVYRSCPGALGGNPAICQAKRDGCHHCFLDGFPYCFDVSFDTDSDVCKKSVFSSVTGECGVKKNTCKQGLVLPMESEIVNGKTVTKWKCLHKKEGKVDIQNGVICKG